MRKKIKKIIAFIVMSILLAAILTTNISAAVWPTVSTRVTQKFSSSHEAIDIGPVIVGVAGDNIFSFRAGTVVRNEWNDSAGYTIKVAHTVSSSQYLRSSYRHLTNPANVSGATTSGSVSQGTKIGEMNTTGSSSTGVHNVKID